MSDEGNEFESRSPFEPRTSGQAPSGPSPFAATPPPAAEPSPVDSAPSSTLRHAAPIAAFVIMLVLVAAAVGVVAGHEAWTPTQPRAAAPPATNPTTPSTGNGNANQFPGGFFNGNGNNGNAPSNTSGGPSDVAAIAAKVNPALVDINSQFAYQGSAGAGTGIVLSSSGEVLTNNHVVDGATHITATDIGNGQTYTATVVGYDPSHDIAVLQLQGASGLTTAKIGDSSKLSVGQAIVGIGNAGGTGGTPSAAGGQITGLNQSVQAGDDNGGTENLTGMIGINANIQPGDSGGPLVDTNGNVIGMDTAGSQGFSISFNGASNGGSAFAIPINTAAATALKIVTNHPTSTIHVGPTAFLGVTVSSGGVEIPGFGNIGGSTTSGVQIGSVLNGLAAAKAGLVAGDTITSIDGTAVSTQNALAHVMLGHHPGDVVKIGYVDNSGVSRTLDVTLGTGPAS